MKAVNLLPPDQRGVAKATAAPAAGQTSGAGAYAVLGALAIGVVSVAGYVLAGNTVKDREAQLAGLTAREQTLQAKVGDLKPYADFAQLASARVATVMDLAGRRFDWETALRDLSRAIPANVTLSSLNGTVSSGSGGSGGSALRGAINAPAISLTGCTTSQPEVAKLMARLRTVDGVTRVSLSKSAKTDVAAPAAGSAPSTSGPTVAATPGGACGIGSPPQFEMVMFFERATQAAAAPTGPAGSAATATTASATATPAGSATPAATPAATGAAPTTTSAP
jgi:Tfp pilus assembly protein PilN